MLFVSPPPPPPRNALPVLTIIKTMHKKKKKPKQPNKQQQKKPNKTPHSSSINQLISQLTNQLSHRQPITNQPTATPPPTQFSLCYTSALTNDGAIQHGQRGDSQPCRLVQAALQVLDGQVGRVHEEEGQAQHGARAHGSLQRLVDQWAVFRFVIHCHIELPAAGLGFCWHAVFQHLTRQKDSFCRFFASLDCVDPCRDQVRHRSSVIDAYNFEMTHSFSSDQVS